MPVGISFLGTAFSEPTLIKLASGFEAVTHARILPTFVESVTTTNTAGTTLTRSKKMTPSKMDNPLLRPHHM
jgi:amidase